MRRPALRVAVLLIVAVSACDRQLTTTERVIGLTTRPDWKRERCLRPEDDRSVAVCHLESPDMTFLVDWRTGIPSFGARVISFADSGRWERHQDSTTRAMRAIATLQRCPRAVDTLGAKHPPRALNRREVWMVNGESRWVAVDARWELEPPPGAVGRDDPRVWPRRMPEPGMVMIETDTGSMDGCAPIIESSGISI